MSSDVVNRVLSTNRTDKQAARMVLVVMADAAYRSGLLVRTRKTLIERAGVTEDTFDTAVKGLIERGAVVRFQRVNHSGKQQCNAYWLPLYAREEHIADHIEADGECSDVMARWIEEHPGMAGRGGNAHPPPTSGGAQHRGGLDHSPLYGLSLRKDIRMSETAHSSVSNGDEHPHGEPEPSGLPPAVVDAHHGGNPVSEEGPPTAPAAGAGQKAKATPSPRSAAPPSPSPWDEFRLLCAQARGERNDGIGIRSGKVMPWIGAMMGTAGGALGPEGSPAAARQLLLEWWQDMNPSAQGWVRRVGDPHRIVADFKGWCDSPRGRRLARETVADLAAFAAMTQAPS